MDLINQTGAAAYFQLISNQLSISRQHKLTNKLDSLNKVGLARKYQLIGDSEINIISSLPYTEPIDILKAIIFTQLVLKLKTLDPNIEIYLPDEKFVHANIKFMNSIFSVIIIRHTDNISILPFITSSLEKTIIVSEILESEFNRIKTPARIILDEDLFSQNPLIQIPFYLPDGSIEKLAI